MAGDHFVLMVTTNKSADNKEKGAKADGEG